MIDVTVENLQSLSTDHVYFSDQLWTEISRLLIYENYWSCAKGDFYLLNSDGNFLFFDQKCL